MSRKPFSLTYGFDDGRPPPAAEPSAPRGPAGFDEALAALGSGDLDEALARARRLHQAMPREAEVLALLGTIHERRGEFDEARQRYVEGTRADPSHFKCWYGLGVLLYNLRQAAPAAAALARAVALKPGMRDAKWAYARALAAAKRSPEAMALFEDLLKETPEDAALLDSYADALLASDRVAEALQALDKAEALAPELADLDTKRGYCLQAAGRFDEAEQAFRASIAKGRSPGLSYYHLGSAHRLGDPDLDAMEILLADPSTGGSERVSLSFALGRERDRRGEHRQAFRHFADAAAIRSRRLRFDRQRAESITRLYSDLATPSLFSDASPGHPSPKPVFIVGLFRSGTTLVEQILAGHPQVFAGGERDLLAPLLQEARAGGKSYPESLPLLGSGELKALGMRYLGSFPMEALDAERITNKLPGNTLHLPFIRRMFPNAAIIHCRRHPLDICLSMLSQHFGEVGDHLESLQTLAEHIALQSRLMRHMQSVLPSPPLEVLYEEVVGRFEPRARDVIAHVGLEWDDRCLAVQETGRAVRTASMWQVRQPVYRTAVARWRNYEKELAPARDILADAIVEYEHELARLDIRTPGCPADW